MVISLLFFLNIKKLVTIITDIYIFNVAKQKNRNYGEYELKTMIKP